jgi:hypothetical protein|nr:hypothetical protein [Kofleriaceae bacterium]
MRLLVLPLLVATACTGMVSGAPGNGGGGGGGDDTGSDPTAPDAALAPGMASVARGMEWVDAMVPYCQSANHAPDGDSSCAATCTRPDMPDWDPYRSDCSGFVSWSWDLPAPGRTTGDFAPFTTDLTHTIQASDLRPGDAINNDEHIMLFEAWTTPGQEAKFIEEPGCSSTQPYARETTVSVTLDGEHITPEYRGEFTAIRYDAAP